MSFREDTGEDFSSGAHQRPTQASATTRPVSRVLLDVLGDTGAPDVIRIRAFGKLALQLARNPR